jgi:Transposase DDE domain
MERERRGETPPTPTNPKGWVANGKERQRRVAKKRKKEDNPLQKSKPKKKGSPHMQNDTPWAQGLPQVEGPQALMETMIQEIAKSGTSSSEVAKKPGRKAVLSWQFLTTGILWCLLQGWQSQLQLWRLVSYFGLGDFAPVPVGDQAVYDRLERAVEPMQRLCVQISQWLLDWLAPYEDRSLVPWAKRILALDESILDSMKRWIEDLRDLPAGDPRLLAGRLSGLFDVRRQQWTRLDFLPDPLAHCQRHAREMLSTVEAGTLLLCDLGYFAFEWFDDLTRQGVWWISRVKNKCSYTIEHVLVSCDGYGECLIFLGAYRSDQTAYLMRLIQVRYRGQWYRYITNVLDPNKLSGADVVRLYARRWDIELAFRVRNRSPQSALFMECQGVGHLGADLGHRDLGSNAPCPPGARGSPGRG